MNKEKQRTTEDMILKLLNDSSGDLLDDEALIETLQKSKVEGQEIEEALKKQEHFQEMFNGIRKNYNPVAQRVSNLYFTILDLALLEPTYQWSLEYYINLFIRSIEKVLSKDNYYLLVNNSVKFNFLKIIGHSRQRKPH
jgi:dynein heavy chain